jgi:Helix-turn-helix domain
MSRTARDWAWGCRGLTLAERLVLLALAELADNDGGQCFPSLGQLERMTELSRRGVTKALTGLDGRLIERERGGPRRSTSYRLLLAGPGESRLEGKEPHSPPAGREQIASWNAVPQGLALAGAEQGRARHSPESPARGGGHTNGEGRERRTPGNQVPPGGEPCSPPLGGEPGSLGNRVPAAREQGATLVGNPVPPNRH